MGYLIDLRSWLCRLCSTCCNLESTLPQVVLGTNKEADKLYLSYPSDCFDIEMQAALQVRTSLK